VVTALSEAPTGEAVALRFHDIAGAERCRAACWRSSDRQGNGPSCARRRPRTAYLASPLCRHSQRRFKLSWVRPGTPFYSCNRQIRAV
jgi:hypothetical protein